MKVIIAGSREILEMELVEKAISESEFEISEVVCGCARGVDELGLIWGTNNDIRVEKFPADWRLGKGAGKERNIKMARHADALIAVWNGESSGTRHMIRVAKMQGLKVYVKIVRGDRYEQRESSRA